MKSSNDAKIYRVAVRHVSDRDFLEEFRADLVAAQKSVLILSPFVSPRRAQSYYPVLHALQAREVPVDIYVRPREGQPDTLRGAFPMVESRLRATGAKVYLRPGMHEKVGVLDEQVLWHGSLNALSHNNTRESMLRFDSPELAREVVRDLRLSDLGLGDLHPNPNSTTPLTATIDGNSPDAKSPSSPAPVCDKCGGQMRWFDEIGLWLCERSPLCDGSRYPAETTATSQTSGKMPEIACPVCGDPMTLRQGIGTRLVCRSADCGFVLDARLSAALLRVARRALVK